MTDVRLLPRKDDGDDFEYEDEHVELESELGETEKTTIAETTSGLLASSRWLQMTMMMMRTSMTTTRKATTKTRKTTP